MKIFVTLLALLALAYSAPQPRHQFHEHYEDFLDIIMDESLEELEELMDTYAQFEEYQKGIEYLMSPRFRNLVYEMEDLPEFKAVVEFLESHNIDILFFVNQINNVVGELDFVLNYWWYSYNTSSGLRPGIQSVVCYGVMYCCVLISREL